MNKIKFETKGEFAKWMIDNEGKYLKSDGVKFYYDSAYGNPFRVDRVNNSPMWTLWNLWNNEFTIYDPSTEPPFQFNDKRKLLVEFLAEEYSLESAIQQIANCNLIHITNNRYSVIYDNGKADLVEFTDAGIFIKEDFCEEEIRNETT